MRFETGISIGMIIGAVILVTGIYLGNYMVELYYKYKRRK